MLFPFPVVPDKYNIDKFVHFTLFTTATIVIFKVLQNNRLTSNYKLKNIVILISILVASTMFEYLQIFIPRRGFNYNDLFANWLGVTTGFTAFLLWTKIKK